MPNKVIYYQGTTEIFPPAVRPSGALETAPAAALKRRRLQRCDDTDVFAVAAPVVSSQAAYGWEDWDVRLARKRRPALLDTQLFQPPDFAAQGWDTEPPRIRLKRRVDRPENQLLQPFLPLPTGWELVDSGLLPRRRRQIGQPEPLVFQVFVTPTGWEVAEPVKRGRNKPPKPDDQLLQPPAFPLSGWELFDAPRRVLPARLSRPDQYQLPPPSFAPQGWQVEQLQPAKKRKMPQPEEITVLLAMPVFVGAPLAGIIGLQAYLDGLVGCGSYLPGMVGSFPLVAGLAGLCSLVLGQVGLESLACGGVTGTAGYLLGQVGLMSYTSGTTGVVQLDSGVSGVVSLGDGVLGVLAVDGGSSGIIQLWVGIEGA